MLRSKLLLSLAMAAMATFLVTGPLQAGTIRDDRLDSQYTTLAAETAFASVGEFQWEESSLDYRGSGILINDQWVLTAAHVVSGITSENIDTMTFTIAGTTYHAAETYYHSEWTGNTSTGNDIGLVKLDAVVSDVAAAYLYDNTDENHQVATLVGYGQTGTGLTGATEAAGTKRAGANVMSLGSALNSIPWTGGGTDEMVVADFDPPGETGDPTVDLAVPTDLEYCAAPGDSGGGWFIEVSGQTYVAGVTSFLLEHSLAQLYPATYGDICGATRVSSFLDWIGGYTSYSAPLMADATGDGSVNAGDLAILGGNWMKSVTGGKADGDFTGDGFVNAGDLAILGGYWNFSLGGGAPLPEPASLILLSLGGVVMALHRRHPPTASDANKATSTSC